MIIDPSKLLENDLFVLSVERHGHGVVLTMQVKRGNRFLLRSPEIVAPGKALEPYPDMHLMEALMNALPPLNALPQGLTLRAERALCGDESVASVEDAIPADPLDRLNATLMVDAMENMATTMWKGFTRIEVRVVRGDNRRRPLDPAPANAPRPRQGPPLPPIGSVAAELEPVE